MNRQQEFTLEQAQHVWDVLGKLLSQQYGVDITYTVTKKDPTQSVEG